MMKRSFGIVIFLALLSACTSTRTVVKSKPAPHQDSAPVAAQASTSSDEEESNITDWSQERQKKRFDWPVDEARMTRGFLPNRRRPHLGLDLAAPKGTHILAAQDGTVIYTGREFRGFGKLVMIEGNGWATLYAHLSKFHVKEGQKVKQGQYIGEMGRTGHATGVHLHFEIRTNRGPVDPLLYLPGGQRLARH